MDEVLLTVTLVVADEKHGVTALGAAVFAAGILHQNVAHFQRIFNLLQCLVLVLNAVVAAALYHHGGVGDRQDGHKEGQAAAGLAHKLVVKAVFIDVVAVVGADGVQGPVPGCQFRCRAGAEAAGAGYDTLLIGQRLGIVLHEALSTIRIGVCGGDATPFQ